MKALATGFALALTVASLAEPARAAGSCGSGGVLGEREAVEHEGSVYYVTTPSGYTDSQPWPLIIGLHGDEGDPANSVNWFWRNVPDGTFIFVAPKAPNASGSWYEEQQSNSAWMDGLVETLRQRYNVDLDRTYIWGLSGGAVFSSRYVMTRMDVFAAAEFNMGGSGRNYTEPADPACKIPARFVVSTTDFLREQALGFYELLTENGHETEWVDADCDGHCFDQEQAGPVARDWLMAHTLCGRTPSGGCAGDPPGGSGGGGNAGTTGTGGSATASGGTVGSGGTGGGAAGSTASGGTSTGSAGSPQSGGSDGLGPAEPASSFEVDEGGCACTLPAARPRTPAAAALLALASLLSMRRRRVGPSRAQEA